MRLFPARSDPRDSIRRVNLPEISRETAAALAAEADMEIKRPPSDYDATAGNAGMVPANSPPTPPSSSVATSGDTKSGVVQNQNATQTQRPEGHNGTKKHGKKTPQQIVTSFIAGGIAGGSAKSVIAPLERVKIMFQVTHQPFSVRVCASLCE